MDPRWEPGAVWLHHGKRKVLMGTSPAFGFAWAHFDGDKQAVEFSEMTEENGWTYSGNEPGGG